MTFASVSQFHVYLLCRGVNVCLAWCLNSVFNVKALVGTFNQKKVLLGAFSVIVKPSQEDLRTAEKLQMTGDV